jgi:uncharacterized membrane protein YbhN (UPF0104 family)
LKRSFQFGFRIAIAIAAYLFIILKIGSSGIWDISDVLYNSLTSYNLLWILIVLLLMPFVWALEAIKWRRALSPFTSISFLRSWRSVWYGVVAGQLTPNRIGEPIGRLALIEPEVRGKAGFAAVWCSFTQQSITVIFGFLSLFWWTLMVKQTVLPEGAHIWLIYLSIILWTLLVLVATFEIKWFTYIIERIGWVKRALHGESIQFGYSLGIGIFVFSISAFRYILFSTQYVILLKIFGTQASIANLYAAVGLTYLFSSFVPSFSVSEVGVRAGFAIWFVGMLYDNPVGITAASLFLWLLNLAVPALIGAWFKWRREE